MARGEKVKKCTSTQTLVYGKVYSWDFVNLTLTSLQKLAVFWVLGWSLSLQKNSNTTWYKYEIRALDKKGLFYEVFWKKQYQMFTSQD